jgi:protein-L-isoaspartate(D-aspartate) O-methyltransferase
MTEPDRFFSHQKKELIDSLIDWGIYNEKILDAIRKVKREDFIGEKMKKHAYDNSALPIECGQTISQPYTVAVMTELLEAGNEKKILEIGTGSGYQAAVLLEMGAIVFSIERIEELYYSSKKILESYGERIKLKCSDGSLGWEEFAPYDGIIVTASCPRVPETLLAQLNINGVLVVPVGDRHIQKMYKVKKIINKANVENFLTSTHGDFQFVPLVGREGWEGG